MGGEGGCLALAACVYLLHRQRLIPAAETVSPLANHPEFALGERSVKVPAATMHVVHPFEVVLQTKVTSVVCQGDIDHVHHCLVYSHSYPEALTNLHLRGEVGVLLRLLVSPAALCLGSWGGVPATGAGVAIAWPRGATGGGWVRYGGAIPPGRATCSGRKFLVARTLCRLLKIFTSLAAASPTPGRRSHWTPAV